MRVLKVIFIVVSVLFSSSSLVQAVPQVFANQGEFDDYLEATNNTLGNISAFPTQLDFVFEVNCTIVEDLQVTVTEGTTIAFNDDVSLIVDGRIVATDAVFRDNTEDEEDPWGSIVLRGDGGNQGGFPNGSAEFNNCRLENGGSAGGNAEWHGMIVLTNGENSSTPVLEMINVDELEQNVMTGSQSDAILIYVTNVNNLLVPTISLEKAILTGNGEGDGCGIHYEVDIPNTGDMMTLDVTSGSEITNFGGSGIIHDLLMDNNCEFAAFIQDTEIRDNNVQGISISGSQNTEPELGLTVDNCIISGNGNGEDGEGIGINVQNIDNSESTVTIYEGCQIFENEWAGVRLHDVASQNRISDSYIYNNGHLADEGLENNNDEYPWGAGVRALLLIDCEGNGGFLIVEGCEIYENGHEGICVSVNIHGEPDQFNDFETIIGNKIYNNGTVVEYPIVEGVPQPDNDDPMEGANIHIFENCHLVNVVNNVINGGVTGICWNANDQDSTPINGRIRNNIQVGNEGDVDNLPSAYGLYVHRHLIPGGDFLEFLTHFYNNIFMENAIAGAFFNPLIVVGEIDEEQFCNNLIGENGVGLAGGLEQYTYNGFWDNTAGSGFGQDPVGTVNADPIFVDQANSDYHLDWNSPMINRGINAIPGEVEYGDAFDAPLGILDAPFGIGEEFGFIDNTRNDIGAYGGGLAKSAYLNVYLGVIPGLPEIDDYGFDPYCAMDGNSADICNDNLPDNDDPGDRDWLEGDYYRIFNHVETPNGETLDIGEFGEVDAKGYFEFMDPDGISPLEWKVKGVLRVNGNPGQGEDRNVIFCRHPDANSYWYAIYFYEPDVGEDSHLYGCVLKGAERTVYCKGQSVEDPAPLIKIYNCSMSEGYWHNLRIWRDVRVECFLSDILDGRGTGISVYDNEAQTLIDRCNIIGNGTELIRNGVHIQTCETVLTENIIRYNSDAGVLAFDGSEVDILGTPDGQGGHANNIYCNGYQLVEGEYEPNTHTNTTGAEIRCLDNSDAEIYFNNVYDVFEGDRPEDGKILSFYTIPGVDDEIENNYWGDIHTDDDVDLADDFYAAVGVLTQAHITPFFNEDWNDPIADEPASITDYELAKSLKSRGSYREALERFWRIINADPGDYYAAKALRQVFYCYRSGGLNMSDLRDDLSQLARNNVDEYQELAWLAKRLVYNCLSAEDNVEGAIEYAEAMLEDAPNELNRMYVELDLVYMEEDYLGDRINSTSDFDQRIYEIEKSIDEFYNQGKLTESSPPSEFALTKAYPNPFNSTTSICYQLSVDSEVTLKIFDISGREVVTLVNGKLNAGYHTVAWEANVPSGLYVCRMEAGSYSKSIKLVLNR